MTTSQALTVTQHFESPPDVVYEAFVDPEKCARWMGPRNSTTEVQKLDVTVGGALLLQIAFENGFSVRMYGTFQRVEPSKLLEFTWAMEGDAQETTVTVEFEPDGNGTELILTHEGLTSAEDRAQNQAGWTEFFDRLQEVIGTAS